MNRLTKLFYKDEHHPAETDTPQNPQPTAANYCEQGEKSLKAGNYVVAMEYFQAAIEADKRFEKAYLLLATAYEEQGKKDMAKSALYSLLAVEPNNENALKKLEVVTGVVKAEKANNEDRVNDGKNELDPIGNSGKNDNGVTQQPQPIQVGNYRIFDGKPEDRFDCFIMFDNGNRLYFKIQNNQLALISPNNKYSHNGWYWEGFVKPKGELMIPKEVVYKGSHLEVVIIEDSAFAKCNELTTVVLPDSVKVIRDAAFYSCHNLKIVVFPNSLCKIGKNAFESCDSLVEIKLPSALSVIELGAFRHCDSLEFVTIPSSVKKIGKDAFYPLFSKKELCLFMEGLPPICEGGLGRGKMLVIVPHGTLEAYLTAPYWQCLNIQEES